MIDGNALIIRLVNGDGNCIGLFNETLSDGYK